MVGERRWGDGDRDLELPGLAVGPQGELPEEHCSVIEHVLLLVFLRSHLVWVTCAHGEAGGEGRPEGKGRVESVVFSEGQFPPQYEGASESTQGWTVGVHINQHWGLPREEAEAQATEPLSLIQLTNHRPASMGQVLEEPCKGDVHENS